MKETKLFTLDIGKMRLGSLLGLCDETVGLAEPIVELLDMDVVRIRFDHLFKMTKELSKLINRSRRSLFTPEIRAADALVGRIYAEVRQSIKLYSRSRDTKKSIPAAQLMIVVKPFWNVTLLPMMSQMAALGELIKRVATSEKLTDAMYAIGIEELWAEMIEANAMMNELYEKRVMESAENNAPSASSIQAQVVKSYRRFSAIVMHIVEVMPSDEIILLFNEMNAVRRKYATNHPIKIEAPQTVVAPIPMQLHTGSPVTPLPRAIYDNGSEGVELVFSRDFSVTYRNNIAIGEAILILHGKGRYTGQHVVTFHIVEALTENGAVGKMD